MTKKIVEYEIEPRGLCQYCKAKDVFYVNFGKNKIEYCKAFSARLPVYRDSCQACKDFLAVEANKVYCSGCKHAKINNNRFVVCQITDLVVGEDIKTAWKLNCKSKEQA
jgi:hypothetical protein